jgi:AcrR family transcriptional regulator
MPSAPKAHTPRERARIEFIGDIKQVARRQLAADGAGALSLRAVARELGLVSASALYRYFPGRDALLTALIVDGYRSLGDAAEAADTRARQEDEADLLGRWMAIAHAVRDWAVAHPHEYALIYGSPVPDYTAPPDTVEQGTRVPYLIGGLFLALAARGDAGPGLAVPPDADRSLRPLLEQLPPGAPAELVVGGITAWTYLFGAVSFEVFGHRSAILGEPRAYFDHEIRRLGSQLGLAAQVPGPTN